jgi:monofunctional glycosyltransferase
MRTIRATFSFVLNFWSIFTVLLIIFLAHLWASLPSPKEIRGCIVTKMHQVNLCPSSNSYVSFNNISKNLKNSLITSEDGNFYGHNGFDFDEMKESFRKNIQMKTYVRGGSTLTQQLAKNMFLTSEKTILRKIKEAAITYQLESSLSKNEILERYLNVVEFGVNIYGVKAASEYYFKKVPANLTVLESAFLTLLLPNPKKYAVSFQKRQLTKFAKGRINQIINRMVDFHKITTDAYLVAKINLDAFPWDGALATDPVPRATGDVTDQFEYPEEETETPEGYSEDFTSEYL